MTDGPDNYSRLLDECPVLLNRAFVAAERWLKKTRRLRNKGQATDADVEAARQAFYLLRETLVRENWR